MWCLVVPIGYFFAILVQSSNTFIFTKISFWLMLFYALVVGVSWTLIGTILGFTLSPVLAMCLSGGISFAWYALIVAIPPGPIDRVTGKFLVCCSYGEVLNSQAIFLAMLGIASAAFIITGLCLVWKLSRFTGMLLLCLGIISMAMTFSIGKSMNPTGSAPRDPSEMKCRDNICAWPEIPDSYFENNVLALDELRKVAPESWNSYINNPILWGSGSRDSLTFVGLNNVDGVLGAFVDQAASAQLIREGKSICGIPAQELGIIMTSLPWPPEQVVELSVVHERLEDNYCPQRR
ncbi:hypothetical protein CPHO_05655 [Corynebacterium phocae]|uniref:Uncharacterized protein n=2 Tax=Corynebacterium phocae TaxID=161895 RepID=A0A1L7D2V2_9CORY|nr:hypothetical protein CPHO_05655 [Corynebacterium phocae]